MYKQGDIIIVNYPLSDKPNKHILRPALIVSSRDSNIMDKDIIACQITTNLRGTSFSVESQKIW